MDLVKTITAEVFGDVSDNVLLWQRFIECCNGLPGITVINSTSHTFPGGGFTGLILLGESHAAIHTWPEHGRAWVELATCGDKHALHMFIERLSDMGLTPERITHG
jgi:S-adenosylmethionine/arginine decarboxylase-like enzyme